MLRCLQCDIPMNEVSVRANPGSLIQLDQCRQCGGIWCDKWELFPIDTDEAERLDSLDEKLLATLTKPVPKTLYCPRCTSKLASLKEPPCSLASTLPVRPSTLGKGPMACMPRFSKRASRL